MPKMKTNRAAAKRFRFTKNGKVKRASGFANHNLSKKAPKRRRNLRRTDLLDERDVKSVKKLMPYGDR